MYFKEIKIVEEIIFRLRIAYTSRLRHLEETAESTPCKCSIINKTKVGKIEYNDYFLYNCKADTMRDPKEIYKVSLNNDIDMMISKEKGGYDTINFKEINFNGESAKDSNNLHNIRNIVKSGSLDNAEIDLPLHPNYFIIRGTLNPNDLLKKKDKIFLSFLVNDKKEKIQKKYQCEVISINPECLFQCDIINKPINTTVKDMNLGVSENSDILLVIKMKNLQQIANQFLQRIMNQYLQQMVNQYLQRIMNQYLQQIVNQYLQQMANQYLQQIENLFLQ